jgi:hypothetical protein
MGLPIGWCDLAQLDVEYLHKRIMTYGGCCNAHPAKARTTKGLPILRDSDGTEALQRTLGGLRSIPQKEVLQSYVRQQQEASKALDDSALASQEVQEGGLRGLRPDNQPCGPSHGSGYVEQRGWQHPNAMQILSRFLALYSEATWLDGSWEDALSRTAKGVKHRVGQLRAIGNGVVPAVVAEFLRRVTL